MYSIEFIDNNIILGGDNGNISIWEISSKANPHMIKELVGQKGIIKALKYDANSQILVSFSLDKTIFKWKINKVKA